MEWFADLCLILLPQILMWHFIWLVVDHNSKHQRGRFKKSLDKIHNYLKEQNETAHDGIWFHELKVIYKNREFRIGVIKKEHNYHYTTYSVFINGDEAGVLHRIGDCCTNQYYFEKQNNREPYEVMEIINATAKKIKKEQDSNARKVNRTLCGSNEYSYFK
jgi:hypothetical protein